LSYTMTKPKAYDLVVIGGGPAGLSAATTAAALGKSIALVDSHHELGGAGANTGTVPSKTLRETAVMLSGMRSRDLYGVDLSLRREATVSDFLRHERNVKTGLNAMLSRQLEASKVEVYYGTAEFLEAHTVAACACKTKIGAPDLSSPEAISLQGEFILIATGSGPIHPAIFPFGSPEIYGSDTILDLDRVPKRLGVIGAGVIGTEYACTFAALGSEVHLVDGSDVLLPTLDTEVSRALMLAMAHNGIVFHWNERANSCAVSTDGVILTLSSGGRLAVDAVLVATGRKGNTEKLNLPVAGITVSSRGLVTVDEHLRTEAPHVYAAGDVIGFPALASTSMEQGRRAARHAFEPQTPSHVPRLLPGGIYTIPEIGMVGETEQSLKRQTVDYVVGRASYDDNARGRIIGDSSGFLKLLFRREDMKLLGVHAIGEQATELVHIGLIAMLTGSTAALFDEACFNIPTLGDLYKIATIDAIGSALHSAHALQSVA
jgi:NAD(P) transhydrogenase